MLRLKDDLLVLLNAAADGQLAHMSARWRDEAALTVVMAAKGYPGTPEKGTPIDGIDGGQASRSAKSSTPAPRWRTASSSPMAAACST